MNSVSVNCTLKSRNKGPSALSFLILTWSIRVVLHSPGMLAKVTGA